MIQPYYQPILLVSRLNSGLLLQFLPARFTQLHRPLPLQPVRSWSRPFGWFRSVSFQRAWWTGTILGIGVTISNEWSARSLNSPIDGIIPGLSTGIFFGLFSGGIAYVLSIILDAPRSNVRLAERVYWTWHGILGVHHFRNSLVVTLAALGVFGLVEGLSDLLDGVFNGVFFGLSMGLSIGLSYWLLFGIYRGMIQSHMENQDRRRFNQRLHRSLRNSVFLSLLTAGIIAGIAVLSGILSIGLSVGMTIGQRNGLNAGLINGQGQLSTVPSLIWLLLFCSWFVAWAATGGQIIMRHYLLRLLLAWSRTFPWRTQPFLEDATARVLLRRLGGGYSFEHRRLLDYFADQAQYRKQTA